MSNYDLTGMDPAFLRPGVQFKVFEANQILEFGEAVFADSVTITWLRPGQVPNQVVLVAGTDYTFATNDRDYKAMSDARLIDETFNLTLIKSVRSAAIPDAVGRTYVVSYQRFRLSPTEQDFGSAGPEPTRGLMKDMVEKINFLMNVSNPLSDITSITLDSIRVLDEDLLAENEDNHIIDEVHTVNVPAGRQAIRVAAGSFYEKDLVVKSSTGAILTRGTDYEVVGLNRGKTRIAQAPSGVYDYIFLLGSFVGDMKVSYRAFGGQVTQRDINSIKDVLADIVRMIHAGGYLTSDALPHTLTIVSILQRLAELEDFVNHYREINHRFKSTTDGKHWFTIAKLHLDKWSSALTQGHGHVTLVSGNHGWTYDVTIALNFNRQDETLRVKVLSSVDKNSDFGLNNYSSVATRNIPELRVVWSGSPSTSDFSGALIQVGFNMITDVVQNLAVRNVAGNVSDILVLNSSGVVEPTADTNLALPDGSTWTTGSQNRVLLTPEEGYLAWAGSIRCHTLSATLTPYAHVLEGDSIDLTSVGLVKFYFYDRVADRMIIATSEHAWDQREDLDRSIIFFAEDLCAIGYKIHRDQFGDIQLLLSGSVGSNSLINQRFDLRQIVVYS